MRPLTTMSAQPVYEEPDPHDPAVILGLLPERERATFLGEYRKRALSPEVIVDLKSPSWVREGCPLVLIGDSGTGRSRLLQSALAHVRDATLKLE